MRCRLFVFILSIVVVAVLVVPSCSLPLLRFGNGASVTFALNGLVIPMARSESSVTGSRLILPITTRIKVDVTGPDNFQKSAEVMMGPNAVSLTINELPVDKELTFVISALDSAGNALTKATVTKRLQAGQNSLTATLKPDPAKVNTINLSNISSNAVNTIADLTDFPLKDVALYEVNYSAENETERQLQFDTDSVRWIWMKAYDQDWNPLPVIASDEILGWSVVKLPAGSGVLHIAVANILPSSLSPPAAISGFVNLRQCRFVKLGGTGVGTSSDPADLHVGAAFSSDYADLAVFMQSGLYELATDNLIIQASSRYYLYGGFAPDWKTRQGKTELVLNAPNTNTSLFNIGESSSPWVFMDTIDASIAGYSNMVTMRSTITVKNSSNITILRSNIKGVTDTSLVDPASSDHSSAGVTIEGGTVKIISSVVKGGVARIDLSKNASTYGVRVVGSTNVNVQIINTVVDGGYAVGNIAYSHGIGYESSASSSKVVIARSKIYGGASSAANTAYSYGIRKNSTMPLSMAIASNMISGGYASAGTSAYTYGIVSANNNALAIIGNSIDTGFAEGASTNNIVSINLSGAQTGNSVVSCNVLFLLSPSGSFSSVSAAFYETNSSFTGYMLGLVKSNVVLISADGFNLPVYLFTGNNNASVYELVSNIIPAGVGFSSVFEQVMLPSETDLSLRFGEWISGNVWRFTPAYASWSTNTTYNTIPVFIDSMFGPLTSSMLSFDLAGNPRPASGIWKIGAFE